MIHAQKAIREAKEDDVTVDAPLPTPAESDRAPETADLDVVIVGAGVAGLYAAYRFRELGLTLQGVEAGSAVGGTWFWNRYPGCRCDVPTVEYSYGFDPALEQEWSFAESMSTQPEIERYLNHVADRHDLRPCFHFNTRVLAATYDDAAGKWLVETDRGDTYTATWCVMATGALSAPNLPDIPGLSTFEGEVVHTGTWPRDGVDVVGKRVGVIGTGSSGVQSIPFLAAAAEHLTVFQRTPNYVFPANVTPTDPRFEAYIKEHYRELRAKQRTSPMGVSHLEIPAEDGGTTTVGGGALTGEYAAFSDPEFQTRMRRSFEKMVRKRVHDAEVAETLIPVDYPVACKRLILETNYFETYNRDNVTLVDVRNGAITQITPSGVSTERGDHELDVLVFATGFDALTGPVTRIDVRGRGGATLKEKWAHGPSAYLGLVSAGFPNMFLITGPGSPSVLSNMVVSCEHHVDFAAELVQYARSNGTRTIDADPASEVDWMDQVHEAAQGTPLTAPNCNSWYLGSNIYGKARAILPYAGGFGKYVAICAAIADDGYRGFRLDAGNEPAGQ
jgi:cation diffusion facilitator CzcD-associated flavoprotein CzcO